MMEKRFVGMKELAVYLGVSVYTIKSWLYNGTLPLKPSKPALAVKMGRLVRFDMRRINELIEKGDFPPNVR